MSRITRFIRKRLARSLERILKESEAFRQIGEQVKGIDKLLDHFQQVIADLKEKESHLEKIGVNLDKLGCNLLPVPPWESVRARLGQTPEGTSRSVVFVEQSYYHFYYLAKALRARGWDAVTVSSHDPNGRWANYFHGQDAHLWSEDPGYLSRMRKALFEQALGRFQMAHFAGDQLLSFLPEHYSQEISPDLDEWLGHGKFVGFTISGCNTGASKDSVAEWSLKDGNDVCKRSCPWYDKPEICSPEITLRFGAKLNRYCSLIACEATARLDHLDSPRSIFEPLTMCLDPHFWRPDLPVPSEFEIDNPAGEILIYHGVGESDLRTRDGINIKGTTAVRGAVERLEKEGHPVRLVFASGIRNRDVRFLQVQADIIVDQLNIGRYGAQAREGLMLGKPVVCYINRQEMSGERLKLWDECPLVSATEATVYEELKRLVMDRKLRQEIGRASREYALKWHSAPACARRFEIVYDALMEGVTDFSDLTRSRDWRDADRDS